MRPRRHVEQDAARHRQRGAYHRPVPHDAAAGREAAVELEDRVRVGVDGQRECVGGVETRASHVEACGSEVPERQVDAVLGRDRGRRTPGAVRLGVGERRHRACRRPRRARRVAHAEGVAQRIDHALGRRAAARRALQAHLGDPVRVVVDEAAGGVVGSRHGGEGDVRRVAVDGGGIQEARRERIVVAVDRLRQVVRRAEDEKAKAVAELVEAADALLRCAQVLRPRSGNGHEFVRAGGHVQVRDVARVLEPQVGERLDAGRRRGGRHPDAVAGRPDLREGLAKEIRVERRQAVGAVAAHRVAARRHAVRIQVEVRGDVVPHLEGVVLRLVETPAVGPAAERRRNQVAACLADLLHDRRAVVLPVVLAERVEIEGQAGGRAGGVGARDIERVGLELAMVLRKRPEVGLLRDVATALPQVEATREKPDLEPGRGHGGLRDPQVELVEVDVMGEVGRRLVADRHRLLGVGRDVAVDRVGRVLAVHDGLAEAEGEVEDAARRGIEQPRAAGHGGARRLLRPQPSARHRIVEPGGYGRAPRPARVRDRPRHDHGDLVRLEVGYQVGERRRDRQAHDGEAGVLRTRAPHRDRLVGTRERRAGVTRQRQRAGGGVVVGVEGDHDDRAVGLEQRVERDAVGDGVGGDGDAELDQVGGVAAVPRGVRRVGDVADARAEPVGALPVRVASVVVVQEVLVEVLPGDVRLLPRDEQRRRREARVAILELRRGRSRRIEDVGTRPRTARDAGQRAGAGRTGDRKHDGAGPQGPLAIHPLLSHGSPPRRCRAVSRALSRDPYRKAREPGRKKRGRVPPKEGSPASDP